MRKAETGIGRAERSARRFLLLAAAILVAISLAALLVPAALSVPERLTGAISWRPTAIGAAVLLGLLLRELRGAWAVLAIGIGAVELPLLFAQQPSLATLATFAQTLLVCLVLGFVGTVMLRLGRSADVAGAGRERAAASAAAAAGAGAARARAAALVHDEVLGVLRLAAAPHLVDGQRLAAQATRAGELLIAASEDERQVSAVEVLREDAAALDPGVEFAVLHSLPAEDGRSQRPGHPRRPLEVPGSALTVLRSAMRQALQNSLLHAGPRAGRRVEIEHGPALLRIAVSDDGRGFDPARVPARRLGLRTMAQAVRAVGGEAIVQSIAGGGTRVSIEWPASAPASVHAATPAAALTAAPARLADTRLVRTGVAIAAALFAGSQSVLAAAAIPTAAPWWAPLAVLTLLLAAAALLGLRYGTRLSGGRTALVLGLLAGALLIGLLGAPFEVGDLWYAGAVAFLLTALAFRGRAGAAAGGGLLLSAGLVTSGVANHAPAFMIAAVSVRPLGVICFSVALAFSVAALLRRIARDLAAIEAESARESWERSARAELAERADEVHGLVGGMLEQIAQGRPLAPHSRARAQALEGQLRDRIRAGRLAVEPLLGAVMRARERGVDVLLLDDLEGELPEGFDLQRAAHRLAAACEGAEDRVTVRVLPAGRSTVLSLVVDGAPVALPSSATAEAQNH